MAADNGLAGINCLLLNQTGGQRETASDANG